MIIIFAGKFSRHSIQKFTVFFFLHIFMYIWDFIVSLHFFLSFNFTNFLFQVRELFCFLFQIYYCTWFCLIPRSYFMTFSFNWSVPPVIFLTSEVYLLFYSYFFTQFFFLVDCNFKCSFTRISMLSCVLSSSLLF